MTMLTPKQIHDALKIDGAIAQAFADAYEESKDNENNKSEFDISKYPKNVQAHYGLLLRVVYKASDQALGQSIRLDAAQLDKMKQKIPYGYIVAGAMLHFARKLDENHAGRKALLNALGVESGQLADLAEAKQNEYFEAFYNYINDPENKGMFDAVSLDIEASDVLTQESVLQDLKEFHPNVQTQAELKQTEQKQAAQRVAAQKQAELAQKTAQTQGWALSAYNLVSRFIGSWGTPTPTPAAAAKVDPNADVKIAPTTPGSRR